MYLQQLSQFWYSDETAEALAREALEVAGPTGRLVYTIYFGKSSFLNFCS